MAPPPREAVRRRGARHHAAYGLIAVVRILAPWLLRQVWRGRIGATLTTSTGAELAEAEVEARPRSR